MPLKIMVIGGSASGPKAAARAKRMDPFAEVTLIQKDSYLSMASCGYPYYVGGFFDDRNMLLSSPSGVTRDPRFFLHAKGVVARTETEAVEIDRDQHRVTLKDLKTGSVEHQTYDKLVIATGAVPRMPPIPGVELEGVVTLQSMQDADYLRKIRDEKKVKKAVIIGGGLIGIETCEALHLAGIELCVVELLPQLLTFLDEELAKLVENHVRAKGANIITENGVAKFLGENKVLRAVKLENGTELPCELAVVAIGVLPNTTLARLADLEIGDTGGILVNDYLQTSDPDIYAVGDCIEIRNRNTDRKTLAPYGDLANLEGRVAGENVVCGNSVTFPGTIHTGICKVFDFAAGSTGLSEARAKAIGKTDIMTVINASPDKPGFMTGKLLVSKMIVEKDTGRLLGLQCVGPGDVSKQIAMAAMAIQGKLTVADLVNADLPYAPPFSLAIDHFIATAHIMENKMKGRMDGISAKEVKQLVDAGEDLCILDVRDPDEFEAMRLGIGEVLLPLGALRSRLHELPEDKNKTIVCYCKISLRGYEAAVVLKANGWTNVKVMEGGVVSWPYPREK